MSGDYYAVVGPLDSDGPIVLDHSVTIIAGDGDNSPTYNMLGTTVTVWPSEEITVLHESLPLVSGLPSQIDFGQVDLNATFIEKVFEIRNDGAQALSLGEVTAPSGFYVSPMSVWEISPGASEFFTVTFNTDTVGVFSGNVTVASSDGPQSPDGLDENLFTIAITGVVAPPASVVGRYVFYNNSAWDAGGDNDAAIVTDKTPLRAGQTVSQANYTNYSLGVNGVMIDIENPSGTPTVSDFAFMVNETGFPDAWSTAPPPTVSVQAGGGGGSSDRVTLV
ncbi:MAG: choice-of-anchor D domain-containing protein [Phycisphaerae bacterium]|jgi:hypothetical protein|nr:choice-of-anchor D domain-containing protein [Phycisphaerae bacterium]